MLKEFQVVSMLGSCFGSIGVVLLAHKQSTLMAMKKLDLDVADAKELLAVQREMLIFRQLLHPNLLPVNSCFVDSHCLYIVSPLAGYGSCADLIANHFTNGLNEGAIGLIIRDALIGLSYLHTRGFLHRSVRGRHILVTATGRAQLSSLRHAQSTNFNHPCHYFTEDDANNLNWLSPEVLAQNADGYDEKSDIYSIGMTFLELVNGYAPYNDVSPTYMLVEKLRGCLPSFNRDVSTTLNQVATACTLLEPDLRPTAQQLLTLPFFKVKGDLGNLLHPVIPLGAHEVHADRDDLKAILASSHKMADISIDNLDWSFD